MPHPTTPGLFRLGLPDGTTRLAAGDARIGPTALLPAGMTITDVLRGSRHALAELISTADGPPPPAGARVLAPIGDQEVWAAGVTYRRSHDARAEESREPSVYDRVYAAERPELFYKAAGWRVQGPDAPIGIRADSGWDVPEPELVLIVTRDLEIAGYALGDDVSSRAIEGENPLYLPQAKVYRGSCAIGPAIVPAAAVDLPVQLTLSIRRDGAEVAAGRTSTASIHRSLAELVEHLGRALDFPDGVLLMTGTGIVPDAGFTLRAGDLVAIDGGPLGRLENPVEVVGRPTAAAVVGGSSSRAAAR